MTCFSCDALSGVKPISPGPAIYDGIYWRVEHVYPTKLLGWVVLVYKTHAKALHELPKEAFVEKSQIEYRCIKYFENLLQSQKEYVACFAEAPGFEHVHFHIIPKFKDHPIGLEGSKVFSLLKISSEEAVSPEKVVDFCNAMSKYFEK